MITIEQAHKVYKIISAGLIGGGVGNPTEGAVCIESAICLALGEPHSDKPSCVGMQDRAFSIRLNDSKWSSNDARADGLRDLGIAQLGSFELSEDQKRRWRQIVITRFIREVVPIALRAAASVHPHEQHKKALIEAAERCEAAGTADAAARYAAAAARYAAAAARYAAADAAARYAARDDVLRLAAKIAVDAYRNICAPGIALLDAIKAVQQ